MPNPLIERAKRQTVSTTQLTAREGATIRLLNNTGSALFSGDVVVLDDTLDRAVRFATAAGEFPAFVVATGSPAGDYVLCLRADTSIALVSCEGPAISPGDTIIASDSNPYGKVLEAEIGYGTLGIAAGSKLDAVVTKVPVFLQWAFSLP